MRIRVTPTADALIAVPKGDQGQTSQRFSRATLETAFHELGNRLVARRRALREGRAQTADGFSVFDFIAPSENVLSDILAFLLDPSATHAQEELFLRTFLQSVGSSAAHVGHQAILTRESLTYSILRSRRRIDIVATLPNFILGVETKKFTGEGWEQISDYCDHLRNVSGDKYCLIFLTRFGDSAKSVDKKKAGSLVAKGKLAYWSWESDIPAWLSACMQQCQAPKIRHFLEDFRTYIAAYLAMNEEEENAEET